MDHSSRNGDRPVASQHSEGGSLFRRLRPYVERLASCDINVLITGETGTGKELMARQLHSASRRNESPFIAINCAAIPDDLLESELFGYERGAFTGANEPKDGKLYVADGGTLFLDEVGDMSLRAQAKILRALENKEVTRLGGCRNVPLDVRVISATNQPLETLVASGKFRSDLFFRVNVASIHLPPLRERKDDMPLLLDHFLDEFQHRAPFGRLVLTSEVWECLARYEWPGNVRELRNFAECLYATAPGREVGLDDLPERFRARVRDCRDGVRDRLLQVLSSCNGNKTKTARTLQWSRMTLYRKIAKYGIHVGIAVAMAALLTGPPHRQSRVVANGRSARSAFRRSSISQAVAVT